MDLPIHTDEEALVVLGVDTHADAHVAVALDDLGRRLGHKTVPSTEAGYAALVAWAEEFGALKIVEALCVVLQGSGSGLCGQSFGHGGISSLCRHCTMEVLPRQQTTGRWLVNKATKFLS